MTQENGTYNFVFYLQPSAIMDVAKAPEGFRVLTVMWNEDRQAFTFLVEGPHNNNFFVPRGEVLPVYAPAVTKVIDQNGTHLSISFPQFEESAHAT